MKKSFSQTRPSFFLACSGLLLMGLLSACGGGNNGSGKDIDPLLENLAGPEDTGAAGKFISPDGKDLGYVVFTEAPGGNVLMRVDLQNLPQGWHGIHLHQKGDCSDGSAGFKASGGHVDPDNKDHGLLNPNGSERADIPNIYAGSDGRATAEIFRTGLSLFPSEENTALNGPYPLLDNDGFAVIIHENRDDHRTQPIGGAGARIACAVIDG